MRLTFATPSKPKPPELVSIVHFGQGSLAAATVQWEPAISATPITGYSLAVTERQIDGQQIGDVQKFDTASTKVKIKKILSTRRYELCVSAKNEVGSGPQSDHLVLSPAQMLDMVLVKRFGDHQGAVLCLALHQSESQPALIVSGGRDAKVCVWSVDPPSLKHTFSGHTGAIYAIAVHVPSGVTFSGSEDGTIRAWNLVTTSEAGALRKLHEGPVRALFVEGDKLYSAGGFSIAIWDVATRACLQHRILSSPPRSIHVDAEHVYTGMDDGMIDVWKAATIRTLSVHPAAVTAICGGPAGRVLTCCEAGRVRLWRRPKSGPEASIWERRVHAGPVASVTVLGNRVLTAAFDGSLGISSLDNGSPIFSFPLGFRSLHCICRQTDTSAFIGSQAGTVALINVPEDLAASTTPSTLSVSS
jgi:WD40 repeat protein